jgi:hypothetical protein
MTTAPVKSQLRHPKDHQPTRVDPIGGRDRDAMIDDACVQLVVSFPAVSIPVGDANALRAGQVVDLGVKLGEAWLTVKVSGDDIGEAQLILVGTNAGVLLARMRK